MISDRELINYNINKGCENMSSKVSEQRVMYYKNNYDMVYKAYKDDGKTIKELSKEWGVTTVRVKEILEYHNISTGRGKVDDKTKEKIQYYKNNYDIAYEEYILGNKSMPTLVNEWGLKQSTIYNVIKHHGLIGIKMSEILTSCDEDKFNIDDPIFCYMAGLISADGYISDKYHRVVIRMSEDARGILSKLREYFNVYNELHSYEVTGQKSYKLGVKTCDLTISSKKLIEELCKLNIIGRKKDLGVRFPDMDMLNDECQEMYMRGLWDGDGSSRTNDLGTDILEESKLMIEGIVNFINSKFNSNIECKERGKYYITSLGKGLGREFYNWLYRNNLWCLLDYKYKRYLDNIG